METSSVSSRDSHGERVIYGGTQKHPATIEHELFYGWDIEPVHFKIEYDLRNGSAARLTTTVLDGRMRINGITVAPDTKQPIALKNRCLLSLGNKDTEQIVVVNLDEHGFPTIYRKMIDLPSVRMPEEPILLLKKFDPRAKTTSDKKDEDENDRDRVNPKSKKGKIVDDSREKLAMGWVGKIAVRTLSDFVKLKGWTAVTGLSTSPNGENRWIDVLKRLHVEPTIGCYNDPYTWGVKITFYVRDRRGFFGIVSDTFLLPSYRVRSPEKATRFMLLPYINPARSDGQVYLVFLEAPPLLSNVGSDGNGGGNDTSFVDDHSVPITSSSSNTSDSASSGNGGSGGNSNSNSNSNSRLNIKPVDTDIFSLIGDKYDWIRCLKVPGYTLSAEPAMSAIANEMPLSSSTPKGYDANYGGIRINYPFASHDRV